MELSGDGIRIKEKWKPNQKTNRTTKSGQYDDGPGDDKG